MKYFALNVFYSNGQFTTYYFSYESDNKVKSYCEHLNEQSYITLAFYHEIPCDLFIKKASGN